MNRDHSVIFEFASKYCISDSFVDHDGYSISSKGFLPIIVDVIVTWIKFFSPAHFSSLIPKMLMFTLSISCLTTSNLSWFMDLIFQVLMQYCYLQHWTLLLSPVTSTTGCCFCFGSISSFFLELFLHWSLIAYLGTFQPRKFIFQCQTLSPFRTDHGVLKARILKWLTIPFSSGPCFVRTLHQDLSFLGGPTWHDLASMS